MTTQKITDVHDELNSMEETQKAHLAGAFDAIGGIALRFEKDSSYRLNYSIRPDLRFQRGNNDDPILGKLMSYCDENMVKYRIGEKSGTDQGERIVWEVTKVDDVERFLEPLMKYFVTSYFRAELMLEVVLPAFRKDQHLEKEGFYELVGIAEKLREGKQLRVEPKYTQEFFRERGFLE